MIKTVILLFVVPFMIFSSSIPKPVESIVENRKEKKNMILFSTSTKLFFWKTEEGLTNNFQFNSDFFGFGAEFRDYPFFYYGFFGRFSMFYEKEEGFTDLEITLGYLLHLFESVVTKIEVKNRVLPYIDFGIALSLGIELSFFSKISFGIYSGPSLFFINGENQTTIIWDLSFAIGAIF
ncbi:hypothetical protein JXR93_13395 [bacterium]|nr:hypothetical protein [bacterium]